MRSRRVAVLIAALCALSSPLRAQPTLRGDVNGDGVVNMDDVSYLVANLYAAGPAPIGAADANMDGVVDVGDAFFLINYLISGGPAPGTFVASVVSPSAVMVNSPAVPLIVNGSGFVAGSRVRFNGTDLSATFVNTVTVTTVVPASFLSTIGVYPVQVVKPDGAATNAVNFSVDAPLALNVVVPAAVYWFSLFVV